MDNVTVLEVLHRAVDAVVSAFAEHDDWGLSGGREGQYVSDLAADAAAVAVFEEAGLAVLSEESGLSQAATLVAVVDPLDGSTNASRPLPWFATSVCVLDAGRARAAVVHDHASGVRWDAVAGGGARVDGAPLVRREPVRLDESIVAINGLPSANPGWAQFRCYGAAALDLCAVADGRFDAFVDFDHEALGSWDYLGGMLICREAGVEVVDAFGRELEVVDHAARRTPVAAPSREVLEALVAARQAEPSR
ncbi:MAG: inositol monophosphatase [Actinomycetota bacterium]